MVFLALTLSRLALLSAFVALPGLCLLHLAGFRYRSRLDLLLALFTAGIAAAGAAVYLLLLANLYRAAAPWLILLAPAAWIAWNFRRTGRVLPERLPPAPSSPLPALDGVALFLCGVLLLLVFWDAATSPLRAWDAVVTWDKWAVDWARRANLYGYAQGGYPQLLPMFSSLLYKITGGYLDPVPAAQYALHAFQALLAWMLAAAIVRAARILELPAWGALAAVFGLKTMQWSASAGTADLLVTLTFFAFVVLHLGWRHRAWESRFHGVPLLAAALFAAAFSKAAGWAALIYLLLASLRKAAGLRRLRGKALAAAAAAPVLLIAPFYAAQYSASVRPVEQFNPREVNFRMTTQIGQLQKIAESAHEAQGPWQRFLSDYFLPPQGVPLSSLPLGILLAVLAIAAAAFSGPALLPLLLSTAILFGVWFRFTSYDTRNLLPAIPPLGICLTAGAAQLLARLARYPWAQFVGRGVIGSMAVLAASGMIFEAGSLAEQSATRNQIPARLSAAQAGFPENVRPFFPGEYAVWNTLTRLHLFRGAPHVIAGAPLYRWHPAGVYPLCDWNRSSEPGDLFVALPPYVPGNYPDWTLMRISGPLRVWIRDPHPTILPPAAIDSRAVSGQQNGIFTNDPVERLVGDSPTGTELPENTTFPAGATLIWQVAVESAQVDPALTACSQLAEPGIADQELTSYVTDPTRLAEGVVRYSGVLALKPGITLPPGGVRFGICRPAHPRPVRIRSFRYSAF